MAIMKGAFDAKMPEDIVTQLTDLAQGNESYAVFNQRIVNTKMPVIGVRVPDLRRLARELSTKIGRASCRERV